MAGKLVRQSIMTEVCFFFLLLLILSLQFFPGSLLFLLLSLSISIYSPSLGSHRSSLSICTAEKFFLPSFFSPLSLCSLLSPLFRRASHFFCFSPSLFRSFVSRGFSVTSSFSFCFLLLPDHLEHNACFIFFCCMFFSGAFFCVFSVRPPASV